MKRMLKLILIDAVIVCINIAVFTKVKLTGFLQFVSVFLVAAGSLMAHFGMWRMLAPDEDESLTDQMNSILQSEDSGFGTYMAKLRAMKKGNPEFAEVINQFIYQIDSFSQKAEALMNLIDINNGKAKEFLIARNNDVQLFLIRNLKKFVKRLIVYNAKTRKNRSGSIEEEAAIQEILRNNNELIDLYDHLLDEVARMGDDFNLQDPGLQNVIESLQQLRAGSDEVEDDDGEIELQVMTSSGSGSKS